MSLGRLIWRSLYYYRRTHVWVLLGAALSTAIIIGALLVGDSLQYSLQQQALERLGKTKFALIGADRFFRSELAGEISVATGAPAAGVLQLPAIVTNSDGTARANQTQVVGVDDTFWQMASGAMPPPHLAADEILINEPLARHLAVGPGDELVVRIPNPSLISRDIPLSTESDLSSAARLKVKQIVRETEMGRFSLQANHIAPYNVFLAREWLAEKSKLPGRCNLLLLGENPAAELTLEKVNNEIKNHWHLADAALELREIPRLSALELRSSRIFIDPAVAQAAKEIPEKAQPILTYFVNELQCGDRTAPYSMVTATDGDWLPADMAEDEIIINTWLADDLKAQTGDTLVMRYYVLGTMRKLEERTSRFRIRSVIPMAGPAADPALMPDFPGISDAESCCDWQSGLPINLDRIRPQDEKYWDDYRGTPKAFITLSAGQSLWKNRYGDLTAIRFPLTETSEAAIRDTLREHLNPAAVGLYFQPVRETARKAGGEALNFGQLFIGFSFFLIIAALLLVALLFRLAIEQRNPQAGLLLALGWPPKMVKHLFLLEGGVLIVLGGLLGIVGGMAYTQVMMYALSTIWQNAVSAATIRFHAEPVTILMGLISSCLVSFFAIWLVARRHGSRPARELLSGLSEAAFLPGRNRFGVSFWIAVLSTIAIVILLLWSLVSPPKQAAGLFFGMGTILLIGSLSAGHILLQRVCRVSAGLRMTFWNLGLRNMSRKIGRSMAIMVLLACGCFLVVAIGANRHNPLQNANLRSSGTGGFSLYGRATLPVYRDLNTTETQKFYGLNPGDMTGVRAIPLRLREGDDASCLNLNRPQHPPLLGVSPAAMESVQPFTFAGLADAAYQSNPWRILEKNYGANVIPAIADADTIQWALGKAVGDTIDYTDEQGRHFQILLAGAIQKTMLQGSLIISENNFTARFPAAQGYQVFLIDTPPAAAAATAKSLTRALRDFGLELTPAAQRLALFLSVENSYLSIFLLLGGLGILLGSIGIGVIVMRNVLERRKELALLGALGFEKPALYRLILSEHAGLLVLGLAAGTFSALLALIPNLLSTTAELPLASLAGTLLLILFSGIVWIWLAAHLALRSDLLPALRSE